MIRDKYTFRDDISRQRKYQLRMRDKNKCIKCGGPKDNALYCDECADHVNQLAKAAYRRKAASR